MKENFTAQYRKRGDKYFGMTDELGPEAAVIGGSLDEVRAKLKEAVARAVKNRASNLIDGKEMIEEPIAVDI